MTDYLQFLEVAKKLKAERTGRIGDLDGVFYDAWRIGKTGFILGHTSTGRIGIYAFVGKDGDKVEKDIEWLEAQVKQ